MKHKKMSRKGKQFGVFIIVLALIISVFSIAFYTENKGLVSYNSGITGAVVGMEDISGMQTAAAPRSLTPTATPPPAAPPAAPGASTAKPKVPTVPPRTSPSVPSVPPPNPSKITKREATLANDGNYYYRESDDTLRKWDGSQWEDILNKYTITATSKNGETKTLDIESGSPRKAINEVTKKGFKVTSIVSSNQAGQQQIVTGGFITSTWEGVEIVTNSRGESDFVPAGKTADGYANELNQKATVQNLYQQFWQTNNLKDDDKSKKMFKDHPPDGININLIDDAIGIKPASVSKQAESVQKIKLPDGKFMFIYEGKEYLSASANEPQDLTTAKNFRKEHPTAKATGYKINDKDVYLEKGKYILQDGSEYKDLATKTEKIGDSEYEIKYDFATGKPEPTQISIDDNKATINSNVLNQLKGKVSKGDTLSIENGRLVHTKTSEKAEGKSGEDSYRKTATITTSTYDYAGLSSQAVEFVTKDKNDNTVDKKKIETTYKYDSQKKKDIALEVAETTYEKGDLGLVDDQKTMVLRTNALTYEPLELEYSSSHSRAGKEKEDLELLKLKHTSRGYFSTFESIFTDFAGLGYFSTLFFDEETLEDMREFVDETLALKYLGTEYWESQICATYTDLDASGKGVAYVDTKSGLAAVAAHIEASKSEPAILPNGKKEILYKITFNVKNGDWDDDPSAMENLEFNIVLKGEKESKVYKQLKVVEKGQSFGALSNSAIVQYSNFNYDKVCIRFEDTPSSWNLDNDELCNTIMGPSSPASAGKSGSTTGSGSTSSGGSSAGSGTAAQTSEETGDTNDF